MSPRDLTAKVTGAITKIRTILIGLAFIGGALISANTVLYEYLHLPSQFDALASRVEQNRKADAEVRRLVNESASGIRSLTEELRRLTDSHEMATAEHRAALGDLHDEVQRAITQIARLDERTTQNR